MKELNVCEDNGKTTIELHPITVRAVKVEEIRKVKTSDKKKKKKKSKEANCLILGKEDTPRSVWGRYQTESWTGCRV